MYEKESYLKSTRTVCINVTCIEFFYYFNSTYLKIPQLPCNNSINVTKVFHVKW